MESSVRAMAGNDLCLIELGFTISGLLTLNTASQHSGAMKNRRTNAAMIFVAGLPGTYKHLAVCTTSGTFASFIKPMTYSYWSRQERNINTLFAPDSSNSKIYT